MVDYQVNTAHTAQKPGHTPSLLELMPKPKFSAFMWQRHCLAEIAGSQSHRKGVKVPSTERKEAPLPPNYWDQTLAALNKIGGAS